MLSCFNNTMRITQNFGDDFIWSDYYPNDKQHPEWKGKRFYQDICKIRGHNGLDVVPTTNNATIYNMIKEPGIIVYLGWKKGYGNRVGIWYKKLNLCEFHNHLSLFNSELKLNQELKERTFLGVMGNSGILGMAQHNHIAFCKVNEKCERLNLENGYDGWLDPMIFIK